MCCRQFSKVFNVRSLSLSFHLYAIKHLVRFWYFKLFTLSKNGRNTLMKQTAKAGFAERSNHKLKLAGNEINWRKFMEFLVLNKAAYLLLCYSSIQIYRCTYVWTRIMPTRLMRASWNLSRLQMSKCKCMCILQDTCPWRWLSHWWQIFLKSSPRNQTFVGFASLTFLFSCLI